MDIDDFGVCSHCGCSDCDCGGAADDRALDAYYQWLSKATGWDVFCTPAGFIAEPACGWGQNQIATLLAVSAEEAIYNALYNLYGVSRKHGEIVVIEDGEPYIHTDRAEVDCAIARMSEIDVDWSIPTDQYNYWPAEGVPALVEALWDDIPF